jgi:uncharacterized protein YrrD
MSHPDPVSWKVVEPGWRVTGGGGELGTVDEVLGDLDADIFNGLRVTSGLLATTYVPAERVREIREGEVVLDGDDLSEFSA